MVPTRQYLKEVVSRHGVPVLIIFNRDSKFYYVIFWKSAKQRARMRYFRYGYEYGVDRRKRHGVRVKMKPSNPWRTSLLLSCVIEIFGKRSRIEHLPLWWSFPLQQ
ncbi:hypothetical protein Tco_1090317 [Tanacetum coccineum]|uniref:Uncharacterized protein n=1 Tax=Tanacetum coccineum TaxID=301880 RepID=A0ABQ5I537_9ASTR